MFISISRSFPEVPDSAFTFEMCPDVLSVYLQCCNIHQSSPITRVELSHSTMLSISPVSSVICWRLCSHWSTSLLSLPSRLSRCQDSNLQVRSSILCPLPLYVCPLCPLYSVLNVTGYPRLSSSQLVTLWQSETDLSAGDVPGLCRWDDSEVRWGSQL